MMFLGLSALAGLVVCPFPASHPYSFLNPVIDPWWSKLDKDTQKQVYSLWEKNEPSLFALGMSMIHPPLFVCHSMYIKMRILTVFPAKTMNLLKRYWVHSGSVINAFIDYLVAKGVDIKDLVLDEDQPEGEGRFKSNSQQRWEDFAAMVQYAKHLKLRLKKSKVYFVEEIIKKKINDVKSVAQAKLNQVQEATRAKLEAVQEAAETVQKTLWSSDESASH